MEPGQVFWYLMSLLEEFWSIFPCAYGNRFSIEDDKEVGIVQDPDKQQKRVLLRAIGVVFLFLAVVFALYALISIGMENQSTEIALGEAAILLILGLALIVAS
jgi:hypothetical protein